MIATVDGSLTSIGNVVVNDIDTTFHDNNLLFEPSDCVVVQINAKDVVGMCDESVSF